VKMGPDDQGEHVISAKSDERPSECGGASRGVGQWTKTHKETKDSCKTMYSGALGSTAS